LTYTISGNQENGMASIARKSVLAAAVFAAVGLGAVQAQAAQCGNTSAGFERWKQEFSQEAAGSVSKKALSALAATRYATKTINADRNQKSFKLSLSQFMQKRGASTIVAQGKKLKRQNANLFASLEARYGVPAGPLIAIWGMETAFGRIQGNENTISAVATLAYDCRRTEFFTRQLNAALKLIDRGTISSKSIGAAHGEIGQTQFLPENVLKYGADGDGDGRVDMVRSKADALASTANFLRAHGWQAGRGYQEGQGNFRAIQGWNAAGVYQKAIALIAAEIDGG